MKVSHADTTATSGANKGSAIPDQRGSSLLRYQRRGHQYDATNKGAGVLDIPGDLEASRQASGTIAGTEGEHMGGQSGTSEVPDIFAGKQIATFEGSGIGH